jgi:hypothetical protein
MLCEHCQIKNDHALELSQELSKLKFVANMLQTFDEDGVDENAAEAIHGAGEIACDIFCNLRKICKTMYGT